MRTEEQRAKQREVQRRYTARNPDKVRESVRKWQRENRERHLETQRRYHKSKRDGMTPDEKASYLHAKRQEKMKRKYGITLDDYMELFKKQDAKCALCRSFGSENPKRMLPLDIDHCHETGRIRGLLCKHCNHAIGVLGDNVEGLERALAYLK